MKTIKEIAQEIFESEGQHLDQAWIDNQKPVMTKDKRTAVILDIDISKVPNILIGQVKIGNDMCDYKWEDNGQCVEAKDAHGNPMRPTDNDTLVKAS